MNVMVHLKGRFQAIPEATVAQVSPNTWAIRVPRTPDTEKRYGRGLERLDEAIFLLGEAETQPALISAEDALGVTLTAWVL
jgi:hypothetical protein